MFSFVDVVKAATVDLDATGKDAERCFAATRLATRLDGYRAYLIREASLAGKSFTLYADRVEAGMHSNSHTMPSGFSAITEIVATQARYDATLEAFKDCFRLLTGKKYSAVRDDLLDREEASSAKVRAAAVSR